MRVVPLLVALVLAWASFAVAQQPTPLLPDPKLTPGDVFDVTAGDICTAGYTKRVRNVPEAEKEQAYREYGITAHPRGTYEVDHLIPLELGGSNSLKNLWPQSYRTSPWNARTKDKLENRLHELVCAGQLDLATAQQEIARNWIEAYKKYVGPEPLAHASKAAKAHATPSPALSGEVWVNTKSGKYWLPGSRYYGRTKQGEYMPEAEARAKGYTPANGSGR
jgi:hypothetical protein